MGWKFDPLGSIAHSIGFWGRRGLYQKQGGKIVKIGPNLNPISKDFHYSKKKREARKKKNAKNTKGK